MITEEAVKLKSPSSPPYYYLMNFNSYASSLITLFHFTIINNWFVTIDMYQDVTGTETFPLLFFVAWYVTIVLVLLNVLIALIIEIY